MIAVKLWGGIGNQLFQYAFGLYLSEKRNEKAFFFSDNKGSDDKLAIECFKVDLDLLDKKVHKQLGYSFTYSFLYRIQRKSIQQFPFLNSKILVEDKLYYLPIISKEKIIFDGYWQSYKYLEPIEKNVRDKLNFKDKDIRNLSLYTQICSTNSVSIHIRKGDYLMGSNTKVFENCSLDYYVEAMQLIKEKTSLAVFYVFSNDIEWTKSNLKAPKGIELQFVDNSETNNPACADLFLMSNCKHHIIANSTFSWWGAWLNPSKEKIVIAPKKWYVGKRNDVTVDLIPPTWIRI